MKKDRVKICTYCGKEFQSDKPNTLCSDECREKQKKLNAVRTQYKKGKASAERMKRYEEEQQKEWRKNQK